MKRLKQKATDTDRATLTLKTCISSMLRPTKHLLYINSKQPLAFVPDGQVQDNYRADPRDSGQAPSELNSSYVKTFMFYVEILRPRQGLQNPILQPSQA